MSVNTVLSPRLSLEMKLFEHFRQRVRVATCRSNVHPVYDIHREVDSISLGIVLCRIF